MNIILTAGILLIIVSLATRKSNYVPLIGFAFVFLIMGFQSNVEGDYMVYKEFYNQMKMSRVADFITIDDEPVMPYIMLFFSGFCPWWLFVALMSAFQCFVLVKFINKYTPKQFQFVAAILFYFSFNMMLLQMKAMRQGLAIELMLLAFMLADEKELRWLALVVTVVAYFTHNSMLVVLPFFLIYFLLNIKPTCLDNIKKRQQKNEKSGLLFALVIVGVYLSIYFIKIKFLNQYLVPLILLTGGEGNRLAGYADTTNMQESLDANLFDISPLIVLYDAIIVFLVARYLHRTDFKMKLFCVISITAAYGDMLFFGAGTFARMIMYFVVFNLVVYPALLLDIRNRYGQLWVLVLIVFLVGYAIKTSYPWITGIEDGRFGTYKFVFWQ